MRIIINEYSKRAIKEIAEINTVCFHLAENYIDVTDTL